MSFFDIDPVPLGRTLGDFCDDLLEEYLDPHERAELDQLAADITSSDTSIVLTHGANVRAQSRVEIGDELLHVWGTTTTDTWTVSRGWLGTTAAAASTNDLVRINPRWPRVILARQLAREIRSWPNAVCAVVSADFDVAAGTEAFDLAGLEDLHLQRILRVTRDHEDSNDDTWPAVNFTLETNANLDAFPSGVALVLHTPPTRATTVRVVAGVGFLTPDLDFTDDLGLAYLLSDRLVDVAMLGVAGRLLLGSEISRTDDRSQQRVRRAEEVPPGYRLQAGQALLEERDRLLKLEAEELLNTYGIRR